MDWGQIALILTVLLGITKLYDWISHKRKESEAEIKRAAEIERFKSNCISELTSQVKEIINRLDHIEMEGREALENSRDNKIYAEKNEIKVNALFRKLDQMRNNVIILNTSFATLVGVLKNTKVINGIDIDTKLNWGD